MMGKQTSCSRIFKSLLSNKFPNFALAFFAFRTSAKIFISSFFESFKYNKEYNMYEGKKPLAPVIKKVVPFSFSQSLYLLTIDSMSVATIGCTDFINEFTLF